MYLLRRPKLAARSRRRLKVVRYLAYTRRLQHIRR